MMKTNSFLNALSQLWIKKHWNQVRLLWCNQFTSM